jgi:hypothetical protein
MEEDRAHWAELLATSLQVSGLTEEELERRLGWSPGSLAHLLDGEGGLAPDLVLEILSELNGGGRSDRRGGVSAFGDDRSQVVTDLLDRFRLLGYQPSAAFPPHVEPSGPGELEKKVESILRRAYGEPPAD